MLAPQVTFQGQNVPNPFSSTAPPQILLGELMTLPRLP